MSIVSHSQLPTPKSRVQSAHITKSLVLPKNRIDGYVARWPNVVCMWRDFPIHLEVCERVTSSGVEWESACAKKMRGKMGDFWVMDFWVHQRQAAQCVGRVIRSKSDYGMMIFADKR